MPQRAFSNMPKLRIVKSNAPFRKRRWTLYIPNVYDSSILHAYHFVTFNDARIRAWNVIEHLKKP